MKTKKCDCLLCSFENPKPTTAAIVIKDQKLLVLKRTLTPFKGQWDLPGGYLEKEETPEASLKREIREELGVDSSLTFIGAFSGHASYREYSYPVLNFAYLTELKGDIKLNKKENLKYAFVPLARIKNIAFDSNRKILKFIKKKLTYDLTKVKKLVAQLDESAKLNEHSLYKAMFNGYVSEVKNKGKLVGMGWIFPRQTLLRRQAVVEDMIVDESQRGKGYGEEILLDLIRWAKSEDVEVVELTTNPKRIAANALYQKIGFKLHETNHYLLNLK